MARALSASGLTDYLHVDVGNNWGAPSYLQPMQYEASEWTAMAGEVRAAVDVPVVYTGRVTHPAIGERILADGHADVVGMARATIADPDLPRKARDGALDTLRPCVGSNECLHRGLVDGMRFSCAVNPSAGHELAAVERAASPAPDPRRRRRTGRARDGGAGRRTRARRDVVGARGPARRPARDRGPRTCARSVRRVHRAPGAAGWPAPPWSSGARRRRTTWSAFGADAVVIATGAAARIPDVPGAELAVDVRDVLTGAPVGERVVLIAGHRPRRAAARRRLPGIGRRVGAGRLPGPAARAAGRQVQHRRLRGAAVRGRRRVHPDAAARAHRAGRGAHRRRLRRHADGARRRHRRARVRRPRPHRTARRALGAGPELHILGDAWAPRRLTIATRQAWELGRAL